MKIVFFGTPSFSAYNLNHLITNKYHICAVVCPSDKRKGRGKKLKSCAVKNTATANKIPVLQPENLKDPQFINQLNKINADLFIVVAFRMLPKEVWKMPRKGTINLHTSLLPEYRGAAPINRVLINGETETGITTFFINENIDSGKIIMQKKINISTETTAAQLHNILMKKGSQLLINTIESLSKNPILISQEKSEKLKTAPKLNKDLLKIKWEESAIKIHNLVRGLSPYINENKILKDIAICPSAFLILKNHPKETKRIKIQLTKTEIRTEKSLKNIDTDNHSYFRIGVKNHWLYILHLQMEGKKPMTIKEFLNGYKINENCKII